MTTIPGFLRKSFEERGASEFEYLVLRMQLATIFLFVLALVIAFHPHILIYAVFFVLLAANAYSLFSQFKAVRNRAAYLYFFSGLNAFALVLAAFKVFTTSFNVWFLLAYLFFFAAFLLVFRLVFSRSVTLGEVLVCDSDWAVVHAHYDLCAGVQNGFYAVRSKRKVKKGQQVKIKVIGGLGERKKPWEILEKS